MAPSAISLAAAKSTYGALLLPLLPVGVELESLLAVIAVEAAGNGIDHTTKKPIIRFEVHQFYERYGHLDIQFSKHFKFNPVEKWRDHKYSIDGVVWKSLHTTSAGQAAEWDALNLAMSMSTAASNAAVEATSFGAGQIMGFNYKACDFATPFDMMRASWDQNEQIKMLINFIDADSRLIKALQDKSWATFARYYNGTGQVPTYSKWLSDAYTLAVALK